MTIQELTQLIENKTFHHATYRNHGTLWEGLHIYVKDSNGFRGFNHIGIFLKGTPELETAIEMVARYGISVGSYGKG